MPSLLSRVQRLEQAAFPTGLVLQPWSVHADGRAAATHENAGCTQASGETLEEFQQRAAEALHPRRPVVWISEVEAAL